jgi:hypothetical protein
MADLVEKVTTSPKTYLPLIVILITWVSDALFPALGLPVLTPEVKESLTVLMGTLAVWFLRSGTVKTKEMTIIMGALADYLSSEIKRGTEETRKKTLEEELKAITDDEVKTAAILKLINDSYQRRNFKLETVIEQQLKQK